jgi:hypothetical protein
VWTFVILGALSGLAGESATDLLVFVWAGLGVSE